MEKIQLQKRNSELKCIQVCLEKYGLSKDWFKELSSKENSIEWVESYFIFYSLINLYFINCSLLELKKGQCNRYNFV